MPTPYPKEFRRDVIAVARQGDRSSRRWRAASGSPSPVWPVVANRRPRGRLAVAAARAAASGRDLAAENRELRKRTRSWSRRTRSCAGRRPTSPATPSQNDVPAGPSTSPPTGSEDSGRGDLPGARLLQAGLLRLAAAPVSAPGLGRRASDQRSRSTSTTTTRSSATGSSPTNSPARVESPSRNRVNRLCSHGSGCGRCTTRKRGQTRRRRVDVIVRMEEPDPRGWRG